MGSPGHNELTHWGRVTHICVSKLTTIGSDNGLSPGRRQAIIWTSAWIFWIGPLGTNFSEILIGIQTFSFKKMHLKMSSAKWRPFCLGLNVLTWHTRHTWANFIYIYNVNFIGHHGHKSDTDERNITGKNLQQVGPNWVTRLRRHS